jgi:peptidoglycan/xylan/chitin deacetylase (PgdA/CDA1 family)
MTVSSWQRAARSPLDTRLGLRAVPLILMYHAIADAPEDPHQLAVAPARFAEQMAWLARSGLRGVGVAELFDAMRAGRQRRLVGITFDDGYASVLEAALPVLQRHGFGATVFVLSDLLGGTNAWDEGPCWRLLTGAEVTELASAGIEIGSHSATHLRLAGAPAARLEAEVRGSLATLSSLTGTEARGFAYPYGSMDAAARRAVHDAGYAYGCAVTASPAQLGLMALPRAYVGQRDSAARLAVKRRLYRGRIALQGGHQ